MSEILPLGFCILFFKKLNSKGLKVFFVYCIILALFVVISTGAVAIFRSQIVYLYLLKVYTIVEYFLFAAFLQELYENSTAKKIVSLSRIPFLIFCVIDFFVAKSPFSNAPSLIEFLAFIIFIIYFFYEKMKTVNAYPIYQSISFWICVGLFIYFTGNFFFFLFVNSSSDLLFARQMKIVYSFVTIIKNLLLCLAFFAHEYPPKTNDSFELPQELQLDDLNFTNSKNS